MGRMLVALAAKDSRFAVTAALDRPESGLIGADIGTIAGIGEIGVLITQKNTDFDVIIDFSSPFGAEMAIDLALKNNAPIVCGTTGLDEALLRKLNEASAQIGVFFAKNFSRGIALCTEIAKQMARAIPEADVEIIESHHRNKADAPSGTALDLARGLCETRCLDFERDIIYCREGHTGVRPKGRIGISAVRGGGIVGEHRIIFAMPFETLVIEHSAISRELFAAGALDAAEFIFGKIGFYQMKDLLNQK